MTFSRARAPLTGALVVFSGIAVLGCSKTLDQGSTQNAIKNNVPGAKSVSCPSGVNAKSGTSFTCTVTLNDGTTQQVTGTLIDDNGHFSLTAGSGASSGSSTDTSGASSSSTDTTGASSSTTTP